MPVTVRTESATRRHGRTTVLRDVSFQLSPGITALLGPNGAGKSTLLSLLSTAAPPDAGRVTVFGLDAAGPLGDRIAIRRRLGFMPQEVRYPAGVTAFGFLDYIAVLKEFDDTDRRHAEVRRVLGVVGLDDRPTLKVRKLSGGQRRRLAFAQALIGEPDLLVLDEPTTGLDPERRASFRAALTERRATTTIVFATHQTEDVAAVCDRVIVMTAGGIVFDGSVAALVATADGQVWVDDRPTTDAVTSWRDASGRVRSVGGVPSTTAEPTAPSVEDAYLLLVGVDGAEVPA
jgi:ABC-2 type transport system ATP-binding protein